MNGTVWHSLRCVTMSDILTMPAKGEMVMFVNGCEEAWIAGDSVSLGDML